MKFEYLREDLQHIRTAHLVLLVVLATLAYALAIGWSDAPELVDQLGNLRETARQLRDANASAGGFYEVFESTVTQPAEDEFLTELRAKIGSSNAYMTAEGRVGFVGCLRIIASPPVPTAAEESVEKLRQTLEGATWTVDRVSSLEDEGCEEIRAWATDNDRVALADARLIDSRMRLSVSKVTGVAVSPYSGASLVMADDKEFDVTPVHTQLSVTYTPERFAAEYPVVIRHWNDVKGRTLDVALSWATDLRTAGLGSEGVDVIGIKVEASYLAIAGSAIVLLLLLYMLAHVTSLEPNNYSDASVAEGEARVSAMSPWIGAMSGSLAWLANWASMVVLPAGFSWLLLDRFAGWPVWLCSLVAVVIWVFGASCTLRASRIARKPIAAGTAA